jgi:translation initiation factor 2 beta subunit (eIF-2beta)/eIF-5
MKVPIPNSEDHQVDPFYRYQRDKILIKKQGQFYVFSNLHLVAQQLHIDVKKIITYMSKTMGQSVTLNKKTNEIMVKSLSVDPEDVLEAFIAKYVLCKKCGLPELNEKDVCNACGF